MEPSTIVSSVQGNNEVSFWDLETGARQKTLWASSAPPMSQTQVTTLILAPLLRSRHSMDVLYFRLPITLPMVCFWV